MDSIRHFYHLFLDGDARWQDIANEYAEALQVSEFPVVPVVGIVGVDRSEAKRWVTDHGWVLGAEASSGYEQITLSVLRATLPEMTDDTAVLYTHSKGAWRNIPLEDQWRRSMLWHLVFCWKDCVDKLKTNQLVGCHWQSDEYFAGNFWWARTDFLRRLPALTSATMEEERFAAEMWLGTGHPAQVANRVEGFPPKGTEYGAQHASDLLSKKWFTRRRGFV